MFLRTIRPHARRSIALAVAAALLSVLFVTSTSYATGPVAGDSARALELQGLLADKGDAHFIGLEPVQGAPSVVLTMVYRTPDHALVRDGVRFSVLSAEGMQAYLLGAPLVNVAVVEGQVLRAGPDGTIVQAALRPEATGGYTVIVHNTWQTPTRYMLSAHGAELVDGSGQTLLVPAGPDADLAPEVGETNAPTDLKPMPIVARNTLDTAPATVQVSAVNGSLAAHGDQWAYALHPEAGVNEVTVRLRYRVDGGFVPSGMINFWVLTQDGLRHVEQGAFVAELNLAAGRPDASGAPGRMAATVRLGAQDTYAVIVFNESAVPVDYALEVDGASLLIDTEQMHLVERSLQPTDSDMAVARP